VLWDLAVARSVAPGAYFAADVLLGLTADDGIHF
jgi:hypothetical protein